MSYYFIVNPKSANGKTRKRWIKDILPFIENKGVEVDYIMTERPLHATELAEKAVKEQGYKNIVGLGGDGTIHEVVNGIVDSKGDPIGKDITLGVVCNGTGSDFIKTLGIPKDPFAAIDIIMNGNKMTIDLIKGTYRDLDSEDMLSSFSNNMASYGMGGQVVDKINNTSKVLGGKLTFMLVSLRVILGHKFYKTEYNLDGEGWNSMNLNVGFIGNGQYNGGGMHAGFDAKLDDGLLDVLLVHDWTRGDIIKKLTNLYGESEAMKEFVKENEENLVFKKVKEFEARAPQEERQMLIDFDGEIVGRLPMKLEVLPSKLDVFIP